MTEAENKRPRRTTAKAKPIAKATPIDRDDVDVDAEASDASADDADAADAGAARGKKRSLVIVESPAKAKTINKYLGRDFVVKASMGHIRDLPKGKFGIDVEHGFKPDYTTIRG